jgi:hypothetical protein
VGGVSGIASVRRAVAYGIVSSRALVRARVGIAGATVLEMWVSGSVGVGGTVAGTAVLPAVGSGSPRHADKQTIIARISIMNKVELIKSNPHG